MKVLWVVPGFPYPPIHGGKSRVFNLLKHISAQHEVTLFSVVEQTSEIDVSGLADYCDEIYLVPFGVGRVKEIFNYLTNSILFWRSLPYIFTKFTPPNVREAFQNIVQQKMFDVIQIDLLQMSLLHSILPPSCHGKCVLTLNDIESDRLQDFYCYERNFIRKVGYWLQSRQVQRYESAFMKKFNLGRCITVSSLDRDILVKRFPNLSKCISIIPNGVDITYFNYTPPNSQTSGIFRLVFVGSMQYIANEDAVLWFVESIFPLIHVRFPDVHLTVVGSNPGPKILNLKHPNIEITGTVDDVRPYMRNGSVFIVPIRGGGGTRLKILEAMSTGIPVVSTSKGCEGLNVRHEQHLLVADTPQEFANCVARFLENEILRRELADRGRQLVDAQYDWIKIALQLEEVYQHVSTTV